MMVLLVKHVHLQKDVGAVAGGVVSRERGGSAGGEVEGICFGGEGRRKGRETYWLRRRGREGWRGL